MTTSTILSHRGMQLKTVRPHELGGYGEGFRLQIYTGRGLGTIELDRDEMRVLLRLLPTDDLAEVLLERGTLVTVTLDTTPRPKDDEPLPARFCQPARVQPAPRAKKDSSAGRDLQGEAPAAPSGKMGGN